jgi:adenosylcobyric acid synthase
MLGRIIRDPAGIEGPPGAAKGLGLLDVETVLSNEKRLEPVRGSTGSSVLSVYEMHMGVPAGPDRARPFANLSDGFCR